MDTLASFRNKDIKDAINVVLPELVQDFKLRGTIASRIRLALTASTSQVNIEGSIIDTILDLINKRRHAIIDILARKTCLSERDDPNASAIALLEEVEQKINNARTGQHRDTQRGLSEKQKRREEKEEESAQSETVEALKKEKNSQVFIKNYNLGYGSSLTIYKYGDFYNIVIKERGEIVKDAFRCEKYEIDENQYGNKYLSIYYSAQNQDADWGYTLIGDDE